MVDGERRVFVYEVADGVNASVLHCDVRPEDSFYPDCKGHPNSLAEFVVHLENEGYVLVPGKAPSWADHPLRNYEAAFAEALETARQPRDS